MQTSPTNSSHSGNIRSYSNFDESYSRSGDGEANLLRMKYKQSNQKVYHDFFKTKMCSLNNLNICKKGEACPFAHSEDELRDKPNLYKTKLCTAFLTGECQKGEDCPFAHGESQLRSTPDLFKTAICNLWVQGRCTAGEQCRFAHGEDDLRPAPSHQKFKKPHSHKPSHMQKPKFQKTQQFEQYPAYPQNFYGYPMYQMPMIPPTMQSPYMMNQPYGFNYGMDNNFHQ